MRYCFLFIALFMVLSSYGQKKVKVRDIRKNALKAEDAFYEKNYHLAIQLYDTLNKMNPEDRDYYDYQSGLCYLYSNISNEKALSYLQSVESQLGESEIADLYFYHLGRAYHLNHQFDKALKQYKKALDFGAYSKELEKELHYQTQVCHNGQAMAKVSKDVRVVNAGLGLNSASADYKPVIAADESIVVFTTRRKGVTGTRKYTDGKYYEDIFIAKRDKKGNWTPPTGIGSTINTQEHEASVGLSVDGRQLIIYKGSKKTEGLFISKLEGGKWSEPEILGKGTIETKVAWETSASISADEKATYFTSTRKGSLGERDIFISDKQPDGSWGEPRSIGAMINTIYDEESPFIHPDCKTLYFSSKGHNTIGGFDIFKTTLDNGEWSKPENVGFPINSTSDDAHFVLTADGKKGYFTSSRAGGLGEQDIYKVYLEGGVILILVKGVVRTDDNMPINVVINVIDKKSSKRLPYVYNPDPVTGNYLMILPPGKNYDMMIDAEGYEPYVANINIPNQTEFYELYQEITLRKVTVFGDTVGQEIVVVNAFDSPKNKKELKSIIEPANADYLEYQMKQLIAKTDSLILAGIERDEKSTAFLASDIYKINLLTDPGEDSFTKLVEQSLQTQAMTSTYYFEEGKEKEGLEPYVIEGDTTFVVPTETFVDADPRASSSIEISDLTTKEQDGKTAYILPKELALSPAIDKSKLIIQVEGTDTVYVLADELADAAIEAFKQKDRAIEELASAQTESKATEETKSTDKPAQAKDEEKEEEVTTTKPTTTTTATTATTETTGTATVSGDAILEQSVRFGFDQSDLSSQFTNELKEAVALLKKNPSYTAQIEGHTDAVGPETYNIHLSQKRAKAVTDFLVNEGIDRSRLKTKGYGEAKPIAPNKLPNGEDNPAGRKQNRRTEIRVLR